MKIRILAAAALLLSFAANAETRYERVERLVKTANSKNAANTRVFELATDPGASIIGIEIGNGPVEDLIVGTHHGNEYGATEVALALVENLSANPIPGRRTVIIPVVNKTGYNANQRHEHNLDPNRDWEGPCGNAHGTPFRLASISAVRDLIASRNFVMAMTLHTYNPALTFPWGNEEQTFTRHHKEFQELAALGVAHNNYYTGTSADVIYTVRGAFEDYVFWKYGMWGFLFELGLSHNPNDAAIQKMIKDNIPAVRSMLTNGPTERAPLHSWEAECTNKFVISLLDLHDE